MALFRITSFLTLLLLSVSSALGANLGQIKAEMKARQPAIEALWAADKIGETNQGLIAARAALSAQEQALVQAENTDRKTVYQAIARGTDATASQVGVQRAAQISKRATGGLWLQDAAGKWYKK